MKNLFLLTILLVLTAAFSIDTLAQKVSKADTIVASTIKDIDPASGSQYSIQSDFQGNYLNGNNSVVSIIQGIGDWELDMLASPSRRVSVNFGDPVPGTNPNGLLPPANGSRPVRFLAQCSARGLKLTSLVQTSPAAYCPLIVAVDVNGERYSLRFNKQNFTGTHDVPWSCTSMSSGKCSAWRMQSRDPNGNGKVIAQLVKVTWVGNKSTTVDYGKYYFSFDITLTKQ